MCSVCVLLLRSANDYFFKACLCQWALEVHASPQEVRAAGCCSRSHSFLSSQGLQMSCDLTKAASERYVETHPPWETSRECKLLQVTRTDCLPVLKYCCCRSCSRRLRRTAWRSSLPPAANMTRCCPW